MKPNAEQNEFIKVQLQDMIKVRETYDELYDHILTALETKPDDMPFQEAMQQIWEQDLGGKRGIRTMQIRSIKLAVKEFAKEYFNCLGKCFSSGAILWAIPAVAIYYYLMLNNEWFRDRLGQILPHSIILIPSIFIAAKNVIAQSNYGWKVEKTQAARLLIRPFANIFMIFFPMILWPIANIICYKLERGGIINRPVGYYGMPVNLATVLFFIITMHTLAYYNMYKNWSKQLLASQTNI
ncbi:MAG: hypothetical protein V4619_00435 [Bacteroidota bacterium]